MGSKEDEREVEPKKSEEQGVPVQEEKPDGEKEVSEEVAGLSLKDYKTLLESDETALNLPAGNYTAITSYLNTLPDTKTIKGLTEEYKYAIRDVTEMIEQTNQRDICSGHNVNDLEETPEVDGKKLIMKPVPVKVRPGSSKSLLLKLTEATGIGTPVHVPLWHSGFWITLEPLKNAEKVSLQIALSEEVNRAGKATHGLVFSNYSVLFVKTIMDVVRGKIADTSIVLDEDDDIFEHIKVQDLNVIIWGLLNTMYPRGFDYILYCKNSIVNGEDKLPKCTFKQKIQIEFRENIRVSMESLTSEHKKQMLSRKGKSVTKLEVETYQTSLEANESINIALDLEGINVNVTISSSSISRYIDYGDFFIENLRDKALEMLESGSLIDDEKIVKNTSDAESLLIKTLTLQVYLHYVTAIAIDGKVTTDVDEISDMLEVLSNTKKFKENLLTKILNYIDGSIIAIVGIPTFTCPTCKAKQTKEGDDFESFIGLDVLVYFFTQLALQYQKALED